MHINWRWLVAEATTTLTIGYAVSIAGTLNGLVTPHLEATTLALLLVFGVWWAVRVFKHSQPPPKFVLPLLGIGAALVFTTLFSQDPRRSVIYVGYWAIVTSTYWILAKQEQARLSRSLLATLLALAAIGLFQVWLWWQRSGIGPPPRPPSVIGNPNVLATLLLMGLALAGHRFMSTRNIGERTVTALMLAVLAGTLVLTGSRAAWGGAVVGGLTFLLSIWHRLSWPVRLGAIAAAIALALVLSPLILSQATHPTHAPLSDRVAIWRAAWTAFASSPLIGVGPFTFGSTLMGEISVPPEVIHAHAHNLILQFAAETGIVGLLALGWAFYQAAGVIWKARKTNPACAGMAAALMTAVVADNLLDFTLLPSVSLAFLLSLQALLPGGETRISLTWRTASWRILAPSLLVIGALLWGIQLPGEFAAEEGSMAAAEEDWRAAAEHFDRAIQCDPTLIAYRFSAAYAYGRIGLTGDEAALEEAIRRYRLALERDPAYSLNWAYLALLEWQSGEETSARLHAQLAHTLAPQDATLTALATALSGKTSALPEQASRFGRGPEYGWYLYHAPCSALNLPRDVLESIVEQD